MAGCLTDVPGVKIGQTQDYERMTGCTVILLEGGAVCGIDLRGQATSTRQIDSLSPTHLGQKIHAILLTGGSAFGLDCAAGVMSYLEAKKVGFPTPYGVVPVVPTAVIFDLSLGDHSARPDPAMAEKACEQATDQPIAQGTVGAGTGASVGKLYGIGQAMKGGLGTAGRVYQDGLAVGALAVVNAFGDICDPENGRLIAGTRSPDDKNTLADSSRILIDRGFAGRDSFDNTVLVAVGTNAAMDKAQACRLAQMAQTGLARTVRPCHSIFDGDIVFAFSTGDKQCDLQTLGTIAAKLTAEAIVNAVKAADGRGLLPAWKDLQ